MFGARRFDAQHGTVHAGSGCDNGRPRHLPGFPIRHIPHATVGIPYSTTFQILVPVDTTYLGLPAIIDSINVTGVTGLPSGFSYSCNPSNCSFPGGSNGCFVLEGSAPTSGQIGSYPLVVNLMVYGRVLGVPQTLPSSNDNYTLYIDQNVGITSLVPSGFFVSQNLPNPFGNMTEVIVGSPAADRIVVTIADLLGNIVSTESYQVQKARTDCNSVRMISNPVFICTLSRTGNRLSRAG